VQLPHTAHVARIIVIRYCSTHGIVYGEGFRALEKAVNTGEVLLLQVAQGQYIAQLSNSLSGQPKLWGREEREGRMVKFSSVSNIHYQNEMKRV